jgi:hypothetical protein
MQLWPLTVACENNDVDPHRASAAALCLGGQKAEIFCVLAWENPLDGRMDWSFEKGALKGLPSGKHTKSYGKWPI